MSDPTRIGAIVQIRPGEAIGSALAQDGGAASKPSPYCDDVAVAEARRAAAACAKGDCKYPDPTLPPVPTFATYPPGCSGWHGTLYVEGGLTVMRYRFCARRRAWEEAERDRGTRSPKADKPRRGKSWRENDE